MPRKSKKLLEIEHLTSNVVTIKRPDPPEDLNEEECQIWYDVVAQFSADWFKPDTYPLLKNYVRHTHNADTIAELIEVEKNNPQGIQIGQYNALLKMLQRETAMIGTLATRMRISQQSSYDKVKAKNGNMGGEDEQIWD